MQEPIIFFLFPVCLVVEESLSWGVLKGCYFLVESRETALIILMANKRTLWLHNERELQILHEV